MGYILGYRMFSAGDQGWCMLCNAVFLEGDPVRCFYPLLTSEEETKQHSSLVCAKHPCTTDWGKPKYVTKGVLPCRVCKRDLDIGERARFFGTRGKEWTAECMYHIWENTNIRQ